MKELNADEMEPIKEEKVNPIQQSLPIQEINYSFDGEVEKSMTLMEGKR